MGQLRKVWIGLTGRFAWRFRAAHLLRAFSRTEQGSALDMFAACEATPRRELRRKYFRHALDEWRHAGVFKARARAVGGRSATETGVDEAGVIVEHGIIGGRTLFERLGERDFLAFVYVAEADAVEQFEVYAARGLPDPDTQAALSVILKDELFHVTYSKHELERLTGAPPTTGTAAVVGAEARAAVRRIRWSRLKEGWLRLSLDIGHLMTSLWLTLLYALLIPPFRLLARLEPAGWQAPSADPRPLRLRLQSEA
ncbi:MAG: ferritin-like domain-containing protein [Deltaproteobacteria bacterium]|nr:ferritin-like domain-containing protein [Deltaproteobacteria bacterium]